MILSEFYYGKKEVFRIYHKGKIIWEKNISRAMGQLIVTLCGFTLPTVESINNVLMYVSNDYSCMSIIPDIIKTDICAYNSVICICNSTFEENEPVILIAYIDDNLITNVVPHTVNVEYGLGCAIGQSICVSYPTAFGLVFSRGNVNCKSTEIALSRSIETTHSRCDVILEAGGFITPFTENSLNIYMLLNNEIKSVLIPCVEDIPQMDISVTTELTSVVNPITLFNRTVIFMNDETKLYETKVLEGYSCKDPVKEGIIEAPIKNTTVSHTYKHSGWSRTKNGVVEDLCNITDDTIFYAVFDEFIRYYTVNFYLDNKLVNTQEVAYGDIAVAPDIIKEGYIVEWLPNDFTIYGDTNFYGTFTRDYVVTEHTPIFSYDQYLDIYISKTSAVKPLQNGQTYVVVWDGIEYLCKTRTLQWWLNSPNNDVMNMQCAMGNPTILKTFFGFTMTPYESDNGQPFIINYLDNIVSIHCQDNGSHNVSVYLI